MIWCPENTHSNPKNGLLNKIFCSISAVSIIFAQSSKKLNSRQFTVPTVWINLACTVIVLKRRLCLNEHQIVQYLEVLWTCCGLLSYLRSNKISYFFLFNQESLYQTLLFLMYFPIHFVLYFLCFVFYFIINCPCGLSGNVVIYLSHYWMHMACLIKLLCFQGESSCCHADK